MPRSPRNAYVGILGILCLLFVVASVIGFFVHLRLTSLLTIPLGAVALACAFRIGEKSGSVIFGSDLPKDIYTITGECSLDDGNKILFLRTKSSRIVAVYKFSLREFTVRESFLIPNVC